MEALVGTMAATGAVEGQSASRGVGPKDSGRRPAGAEMVVASARLDIRLTRSGDGQTAVVVLVKGYVDAGVGLGREEEGDDGDGLDLHLEDDELKKLEL